MSSKESDVSVKTATTAEIAEILGLSKRRIGQLAEENALVKIARGTYDLPKSIQMYVEYQVSKAKGDGELDKYQEEALWTKVRRQKSEVELKIMTGHLHRAKDVEHVMNHMLAAFRSQLLTFPTKVAPAVTGKREVMVVKEILKNEIYDLMTELSNYDPDVFYARSDDKIFVDEKDGENVGRTEES